ncbi:MAG: acyltransferase family protein, partial [Marinobacter sp.]
WALSVQGQFYFFWPLLISALLWLAARARSNPSRWIQAGLAAVFVASLGYSVITTRTDQAFAYFDTLARMWEFALGGLLVFILPRLRLSAAARAVLGWTGLLAIVSCGFLLPVEGAFPGYAALWPTLGAAAVLAGGSDSRYGANLVLASRPIAWFGDIAYSFYLWHWPLFILFMVMTPATQPGFVEGTTLILMAGVLAWLTTRWIEEPIRFASFSKKGTRHAFALGAACCLPAVALLGGWSLYTVSERAEARSYEFSVGDPHYPGAAAVAGQAYEREESLYPHFFTLAENVPRSYFDGCHQGLREVEAVPCRYGRPDGPVTVALVGGSHSTQWLPALKQLARRHGWTILNLTKSDCWFSSEVRPGRDTCQQWNLNVMRLLLKNPPDYVFTLATRAGEALEYVPDGYVQQWSALEKLGVRVLAVRDNPWWKKRSPSDCVAVFGEGSEHCRMPRHKGLARVTPTSDGSLPGNTHILDLSRFFCDEDECFPTAGNVLIYRDRHHISKAYVQSLTPYLEQQLSKAAPELVRTGQGGLASGAGR